MKATIYGSRGLLGSMVVTRLPTSIKELYCPSSEKIDLTRSMPLTKGCMDNNDIWINAAARVGGVKANTDYVSDFYLENIKIGSNVMESAHRLDVKKLVSILSTCIYPDAAYVKYPLTEDQLHNGPPHHSNFGYAYAKRMLDVQSRAYRKQHDRNFITVVPNNLYGPNDNYDVSNGHVIPSLIRKFFEADRNGTDVVIWGTGRPLREFTYSADAADAIWWCAENYDEADPVNIGCTEEISIGDLASLIGRIISFKGQLKFDSTKPDGQFRKPSCNKKLISLGYSPKYTPLSVGLEVTIDHFVKNYPRLRGI